MAKLPFGTAQADVLLKLTSPRREEQTWSIRTGIALYESRALTDAVCQSLVRHGFLDEELRDSIPAYTVTAAGQRKAHELRGREFGSDR